MSIAAGEDHTCAMLGGLSPIVCWGGNDHGQLGDGTNIAHPQPRSIVIMGDWFRLSGGGSTTCVDTITSAYCWGAGGDGQLARGTTDDAFGPRAVGAFLNEVRIGAHHGCAMVSDGAACWGSGIWGQLGDGSLVHDDCPGVTAPVSCAPTPVPATELGRPAQLFAGADVTCTLDTDGRARCLGWNGHGQLGDDDPDAVRADERATPMSAARRRSGRASRTARFAVLRPSALALTFVLATGCGASSAERVTPAQVTDARPADQGALGQLGRRWPDQTSRTCAITWTSPGTTWLYDGTMTLRRTGARVVGAIYWRLVTADANIPELRSRQGSTATEQIEGAFDGTLGAFVLHTTSLGDPTLIGAATYRLDLTEDGFRGATAGAEDGVWDGDLRCSAPR